MTTTLYGIPNCDTVKKARTWLADQQQDFDFHDFKKQGLTRATVAGWLKHLSTAMCWSTAKARPGARCQTNARRRRRR
jgi:arsenate reductase-like glutaredoxin family protein